MIDLSEYAGVEFYSGKPKSVSASQLKWEDHDYSLTVEASADGNVYAIMNCGESVWRSTLDVNRLKASIDAALTDASMLGAAANYMPEA